MNPDAHAHSNAPVGDGLLKVERGRINSAGDVAARPIVVEVMSLKWGVER